MAKAILWIVVQKYNQGSNYFIINLKEGQLIDNTHFKAHQFQKDIIMVAVGHYLRFNLSYRGVAELIVT